MKPILTLFFIPIILIIIPTVSTQKELNCPNSMNEVIIDGVWEDGEHGDDNKDDCVYGAKLCNDSLCLRLIQQLHQK